jgi:phosphoribosylformimino-5-aminoimidazole carboxamide ribotide isomerase
MAARGGETRNELNREPALMIAIPALDLRDGHCVQLVGGDYAKEEVRLDDPVEVARRWMAAGFLRLHVVDLDAATGRGENSGVLRDLLRHVTVPVQLGGGVRDDESVDAWLGEGADRVIVGTRGVEDPAWLADRAAAHPGRIVLAADVTGRQVMSRGWTSRTQREILDLVSELRDVPLAGLLVTAVHREGRLEGTDLPLMEDVADAAAWPVIASGGISSLTELRSLEDRGIAAAVLGMALYTGALDARAVAEEFSS